MTRGGFVAGDFARGFPAYVEVINDPNITIPSGPPYTATKADFANLIYETAVYAMKFQYGSVMPGGARVNGAWSNVALDDYQLPDIASFMSPPAANYPLVLGLAMEAGAGLDPDKNAELRSYFAAYLDANQRHFKADYGYHSKLALQPPDIEDRDTGRVLELLLRSLDQWGAEQYPTTPPGVAPLATPTISPINCAHKQSMGNLPYFIKLTWGAPVPSSQARLDALNDRTRVYYLQEDASGEWTREQIWPETTKNWFGPPTYPSNAIQIKATPQYWQAPPQNVPGGRFKYVVVTWDVDQRWTQDTSVQE